MSETEEEKKDAVEDKAIPRDPREVAGAKERKGVE